MLRFEIGFNAGSRIFKLCQRQIFSMRSSNSTDSRELTFAWPEEVIGERKGDQASQGQDEEGEELTLDAHKARESANLITTPYQSQSLTCSS